jgi:hypothetical protein
MNLQRTAPGLLIEDCARMSNAAVSASEDDGVSSVKTIVLQCPGAMCNPHSAIRP